MYSLSHGRPGFNSLTERLPFYLLFISCFAFIQISTNFQKIIWYMEDSLDSSLWWLHLSCLVLAYWCNFKNVNSGKKSKWYHATSHVYFYFTFVFVESKHCRAENLPVQNVAKITHLSTNHGTALQSLNNPDNYLFIPSWFKIFVLVFGRLKVLKILKRSDLVYCFHIQS